MTILKKLVATLTITAVFLSLTGFGCKQNTSSVRAVSLEYWTVFDDVGTIRSLLDDYRGLRPYLTVNVRQLRQDEFYTRLIEALAEDKGPDIISVNSRDLNAYLSKLQAMPPSVKDTTVTVTKGQFSDTVAVDTQIRPMVNANQLDKEFVQTVKQDVMRNNKIYGLPLSVDVMALYYNKDLLDRAGIPEAPKTWEEFQADVKLLSKFDKTTNKIIQAGAAMGTGSNIPGSTDLLYILFTQSQLRFVNANGGASFNAMPSNVQNGPNPSASVLNFYTDFANPARDTYTWNEDMPNALDSFVNGQLAFFFGYSYQYATIKARAPQLNFEVTPMLQLADDKPVNTANVWLQTVLQKSKHSNEAWAVINYLTHSSATKQYLDRTSRPTALRVYVADQKSKPALAPFASQVLVADNWYHGKDFAAAEKAISDMLHEWLQPVPGDSQVNEWQQNILNRGAAKLNQTL